MPPRVSIVLETVTARFEAPPGSLAELLRPTLAAVARQTYPAERVETIVVTDSQVLEMELGALTREHPDIRLVTSRPSYFAAKNAGAAAACGELVLLLDRDCVPEDDWIDRFTGRFEEGIAAVCGRSRYAAVAGMVARLFSIPDFGYVFTAPDR
jgi:cellulose synthase/poly-beta-1,6-N-acetylglucosamine synthase-like glycosyltransferase